MSANIYVKTEWKDQIRDPQTGIIIEQGTRFTAKRANNIEEGIFSAKEEIVSHEKESATIVKKGHVQLSNAVDSSDETKAATSKAVKTAMEMAEQAFQSASNGKNLIKQAVTGVDPSVVVPINPTFNDLANAVSEIETGKRWAKGSLAAGGSNQDVTVSGLNFKPRLILIGIIGSESSALAHTFWSNDLDPTRGYLGGTNEPYTLSSLGHYVITGGFKLKRHFTSTQSAFWIAYE